ncbi:MAG: hypothetical protein ACI97K_003009 [Glaciecola sp.]|jgi:hypothetical protein
MQIKIGVDLREDLKRDFQVSNDGIVVVTQKALSLSQFSLPTARLCFKQEYCMKMSLLVRERVAIRPRLK